MRISDWSSDVCSSDLGHRCVPAGRQRAPALRAGARGHAGNQSRHRRARPLRALPRRRREPPELRRADLRCRCAAPSWPVPPHRPGRPRCPSSARFLLRPLPPRPLFPPSRPSPPPGLTPPPFFLSFFFFFFFLFFFFSFFFF